MYVLAALACFHARAQDGDLEVRTVFESLGVKRFPAQIPAFTVVSRVAWGPGEVGGGVLGFDLLDGRGRPLMEPIRVRQRVEPAGPDRLAVLEADYSKHLAKPFHYDDLLSAIEEVAT